MLDEEGRLMVLRSLLARKRKDLKLFRASARLNGFARQLSVALRELQRHQLAPEDLLELATQVQRSESLSYKLQDLARLLRDYLDWLGAHGLQDADSLLPAATAALRPAAGGTSLPALPSHLWIDGFAEFTEQELDLLAALIPCCGRTVMTLCLDRLPARHVSWLSSWSAARRNFEKCRHKFAALPHADIQIDILARDPDKSRFTDNPVLQHLERNWSEPEPYPGPARTSPAAQERASRPDDLKNALSVSICADPEAEATLAAREILRHVRAGGRYREVTVLVRTLEAYHHALQRVFSRYGIPLFLDRRESVSHHPLAELTRSALRTVTFQWQPDDWFAALKTGLAPAAEIEIDRLENEALARGWQGAVWQNPLVLKDDAELTEWLADMHVRLLPPFQKLALDLAVAENKPTGRALASALRQLWSRLHIEETLRNWAATEATGSAFHVSGSVHRTVWEQMNAWLENLELAFPTEQLSLREWLPVLEAGLGNLSVGVIPPALDQVLVGSVDRSRNPDLKLAIVLGLNETVFPSLPETNLLLTETDRAELEKFNPALSSTAQQHLSRERYHAYVACTRARRRLMLTCARTDTRGNALNPSPFLSHLRRLFPRLAFETPTVALDWRESEHVTELIGPLLKLRTTGSGPETPRPPGGSEAWRQLGHLACLRDALETMDRLVNPAPAESLAPGLADKLYGPVLRTSVSRMEQFAACPFKFFVHSGLRAQERQRFELDIKEQGTFQHDVLAIFHEQLRAENQRWRDLTAEQARARVAAIAKGLMASYREGLLEASEETRFMARILTESLQDFVETLVQWMHTQYAFDPVAVELPFGGDPVGPAWAIGLTGGRRLELYGRIDRIDRFHEPGSDGAWCVVIDYKSSHKQLDPVLMQHGLQLQLLAYLSVLRRWPAPERVFGAQRLIPAGVFYVNLRGQYEREANRIDALADPGHARKLAYRHTGRFDQRALRHLDRRPEAQQGDQFNYRLTQAGALYKNSREAMDPAQFQALLDSVEVNLRQMGERIYVGEATVAPYKKGAACACEQCSYQGVCRIDPWTHSYRVLRPAEPSPV